MASLSLQVTVTSKPGNVRRRWRGEEKAGGKEMEETMPTKVVDLDFAWTAEKGAGGGRSEVNRLGLRADDFHRVIIERRRWFGGWRYCIS